MEEKTVLQPVGCAPKQSFVLQPLVGLLPKEKISKAPPIWRNYWSEGELCILAGDTGAGKSLLSLTVAKEIARGYNDVAPQRVLYIGHDYDTRGFAERYGAADETAAENFFFALFNQGEYGVYKSYEVFKDWLITGLVNLLDQTQARMLIFDQPDRLNLSNAQWIDFLNVVEGLRRERGLSVLLVVSTRTRNTGRSVELYHAYKHQFTTTFADSVVAVCRSQQRPQERYIKHLKCKNRMPHTLGMVDVFSIEETEDNHLEVVCEEAQREVKLLPRSKEQARLDKIMTAEGLRREGVSIQKIAELFDLPESTMRSWVGGIKVEEKRVGEPQPRKVFSWQKVDEVALTPGPSPEGEGSVHTSPSLCDTPDDFIRTVSSPTLGGEIDPPHLSVAEAPLQGGDKAEPKIVVREMMSFKPTIVPEKPLDEYPQDCTVLLLPEEYKHEDFRINVKIVSRG
jgi:hypothetical protein